MRLPLLAAFPALLFWTITFPQARAVEPPVAHPGSLLRFDFNHGNPWPQASSDPESRFLVENTGTIDSYRGVAGGAMSLTSDAKNAGATLATGALSFQNTEANLAKLTLSFDLWSSDVRQVKVVVRSLDGAGKITGSLSANVLPPVEGAFFRFSIDLDKAKPGEGKFDPLAPQIALAFEPENEDVGSTATTRTLRIDNLTFTAPAFYVSEKGNDSADGRSEATAFLTIQKAVDASLPGDVICIMDGQYSSTDREQIVSITKSGSPAGWIVLRAYPGHHPELRPTGWNGIRFNGSASYFEIRGLTVRGNAPSLKLEDALADGAPMKDGKNYVGAPLYNGNGISVQNSDVATTERPHHIRIIDNIVSENAGGGISMINCDYATVQGNISADNCHTMRYAGSGISIFRSWDFDAFKGTKNFVLGNISRGNRCFVPWTLIGKISDGNGIIIDDNICHQGGASKVPYEGRTLVQNNLIYGNGGSGVHAYASRFVDIVHNTAYQNAQSPELSWGQIFAGGDCDDIRVIDNILYAQKGKPVTLSIPRNSQRIVYSHNLSFGEGDNDVASGGGLGNAAESTEKNSETLRENPKFVRASLGADADFHLAPDSPAIDAGAMNEPGIPRNDLEGKPRPQGKAPDLGAYEVQPFRPVFVNSPEIHPDRTVTFRLYAPEALNVKVWLDWHQTGVEMTKDEKGVWSTTVGPIDSDIWGYSFRLNGLSIPDPSNPGSKPSRMNTTSPLDVPGEKVAFFDPVPGVPRGTVHLHDYDSKSLGHIRRLRVYTPPGYEADPKATLPVLFLLHGSGDNEATWSEFGKANLILDNLIAQKKAVPMIVVMTDGHAVPGYGPESWNTNTVSFERDFLEDVMPFVQAHYPVATDRDKRAIAGLSMGGNQSILIGLNHRDLFAWVGGMSSAVREIEKPLASFWAEPVSEKTPLKLLWLTIGKEDFLIRENRAFDAMLTDNKVPHAYIETEGAHQWVVWRRALAELAPLLFR